MRDRFQIWVDAVCEQVRFRPDRKDIEKELRIHYEDHVNDLLRLGRDPALAEERALAAMGNAQEVGRALDRVHKPWLGWLWEASRMLLLALVLLTLAAALQNSGGKKLFYRTQAEWNWEEPPASAVSVELEHGTLYAAPGDVTEEDGHTAAEIRLWMKMRDPLAALGGVWPWQFTWRDEQGELSRFRYDEIARTWPESRCWNVIGKGMSSGWTRFRQTVRLTLDGPPQWVEISYPLSGQDWTLRVEWEEEP